MYYNVHKSKRIKHSFTQQHVNFAPTLCGIDALNALNVLRFETWPVTIVFVIGTCLWSMVTAPVTPMAGAASGLVSRAL